MFIWCSIIYTMLKYHSNIFMSKICQQICNTQSPLVMCLDRWSLHSQFRSTAGVILLACLRCGLGIVCSCFYNFGGKVMLAKRVVGKFILRRVAWSFFWKKGISKVLLLKAHNSGQTRRVKITLSNSLWRANDNKQVIFKRDPCIAVKTFTFLINHILYSIF